MSVQPKKSQGTTKTTGMMQKTKTTAQNMTGTDLVQTHSQLELFLQLCRKLLIHLHNHPVYKIISVAALMMPHYPLILGNDNYSENIMVIFL